MDIIGVTFPIPKAYIARFFDGGKTVFIKPAVVFKDLQIGMKFVFYQSQEDAGYVGEAIIKGISMANNPHSFFDLYGDKIFLEEIELDKYIERIRKRREYYSKVKTKPRKRKWIAIELESIRKYRNTRKPNSFIPIGGQYLKKE